MNEAKKSSRFGAITPEVLREIKAAVGEKNVYVDKDDLASYSYDMTGQIFAHGFDVLVKPENTGQVSALMKVAAKHRIPVTPRAAGSGLWSSSNSAPTLCCWRAVPAGRVWISPAMGSRCW